MPGFFFPPFNRSCWQKSQPPLLAPSQSQDSPEMPTKKAQSPWPLAEARTRCAPAARIGLGVRCDPAGYGRLGPAALRQQAQVPSPALWPRSAAALYSGKASQAQPRNLLAARRGAAILGVGLIFFPPLPSPRRREPPLTGSGLPRPEQRAPPEAIPLRLPENARERKKGAKERARGGTII